ncbi:hypothetical protein HHK36_025332 [Tetracentron sinense]|uniref:Uncharacterized protein n=1 Tax=Tetracentron sinense TaxID=13715 RepID=A0A834YKX7_TETSI|nr:hypothetical protein HHK36_025332 [Tetracentron sinense]
MALNPQLFPNGMPVPFVNEMFVLARDGAEFEIDKIPGTHGGNVKAKGTIYLSNIRMVFVAIKPFGTFLSFDMPLVRNVFLFLFANCLPFLNQSSNLVEYDTPSEDASDQASEDISYSLIASRPVFSKSAAIGTENSVKDAIWAEKGSFVDSGTVIGLPISFPSNRGKTCFAEVKVGSREGGGLLWLGGGVIQWENPVVLDQGI